MTFWLFRSVLLSLVEENVGNFLKDARKGKRFHVYRGLLFLHLHLLVSYGHLLKVW